MFNLAKQLDSYCPYLTDLANDWCVDDRRQFLDVGIYDLAGGKLEKSAGK